MLLSSNWNCSAKGISRSTPMIWMHQLWSIFAIDCYWWKWEIPIMDQEEMTMKTTRNNILYYASTALIIETAISLGFTLLVSLFGGIAASWLNRGTDVSGYFLGVLGFSIFFLALLAIVISLAYFYAGFTGRKNADNPQAGRRLFIFASSCSSYRFCLCWRNSPFYP